MVELCIPRSCIQTLLCAASLNTIHKLLVNLLHKVLVNTQEVDWLCPDMNENLLTRTLNLSTNKQPFAQNSDDLQEILCFPVPHTLAYINLFQLLPYDVQFASRLG